MSRKLPLYHDPNPGSSPPTPPINNQSKRQRTNNLLPPPTTNPPPSNITPKQLRTTSSSTKIKSTTTPSSISLSSQRLFSSRSIQQSSLSSQKARNPLSLTSASTTRPTIGHVINSFHRPDHLLHQNRRQQLSDHENDQQMNSGRRSSNNKSHRINHSDAYESNNQGYYDDISPPQANHHHHHQHSYPQHHSSNGNHPNGLLDERKYRFDLSNEGYIDDYDDGLISHHHNTSRSKNTTAPQSISQSKQQQQQQLNEPRRNLHSVISVQPKAINTTITAKPQQPPQLTTSSLRNNSSTNKHGYAIEGKRVEQEQHQPQKNQSRTQNNVTQQYHTKAIIRTSRDDITTINSNNNDNNLKETHTTQLPVQDLQLIPQKTLPRNNVQKPLQPPSLPKGKESQGTQPYRVRAPSLIQLAEMYAVNYERDPFSLSYCNKILNNSLTPSIILLPETTSIDEYIDTHVQSADNDKGNHLAQIQHNSTNQHHLVSRETKAPTRISYTPTLSFYNGQFLVDSMSPLRPLLIQSPIGYDESNKNSTHNTTNTNSTHNSTNSFYPSVFNAITKQQPRSGPNKPFTLYICPSFSLTQPQFTRIPISHYLLSSYKQSISFNSDEILTLFDTYQIEQRLIPPYPCIMSYLLRICDYFRLRFDVFMNSMECLMYLIKDKLLKQWEEMQNPTLLESNFNIIDNDHIHHLPHHEHQHNQSAFTFSPQQFPLQSNNTASISRKITPNSRYKQGLKQQQHQQQPPTSLTQQSHGPISDNDYIILTQRDVIIAIVFSTGMNPSMSGSSGGGSYHHTNNNNNKMLSKDNFNQSKTKRPQLTTQALFTRFFLDYLPGLDLYSPLSPQQNSNSSTTNDSNGYVALSPLSITNSNRSSTNPTTISPHFINNDPLVMPFLTQYGLLQHELNLLHHASLKTSNDNEQDENDCAVTSVDQRNTSINQTTRRTTKQSHNNNSVNPIISGSLQRPAGGAGCQGNVNNGNRNSTLQVSTQPIQPFSSKSLFYSELSLFSTLVYNVSFLHTSNYMTILDSLLLVVINYIDIYDLLDWFLYTIFGPQMIPQQLKEALERERDQRSTISHHKSAMTLQPTTITQQHSKQQHFTQQHPALPTRLSHFLQKQLATCPYSFCPTQFNSNSSNKDVHPTSKLNSTNDIPVATPNTPTTPNLPPLLRQKQVITILRFLCEILIKSLLMTQPITFQFRWPSDILCGVIVATIVHLFPLDHTTLKQNLVQNQSHHVKSTTTTSSLYSPHSRSFSPSALSNTNETVVQNTPIQYNSPYHLEIDKRIQQQLLYFSSTQSNQDIHPNHYSTSTSIPNQEDSKAKLLEQWVSCYDSVWLGAFLPWLMTNDTNNIGHTGGANLLLSPHNDQHSNPNGRKIDINDYGVIKSNITSFSSMSFYQLNLSSLYHLKVNNMIQYQQSLLQSQQIEQELPLVNQVPFQPVPDVQMCFSDPLLPHQPHPPPQTMPISEHDQYPNPSNSHYNVNNNLPTHHNASFNYPFKSTSSSMAVASNHSIGSYQSDNEAYVDDNPANQGYYQEGNNNNTNYSSSSNSHDFNHNHHMPNLITSTNNTIDAPDDLFQSNRSNHSTNRHYHNPSQKQPPIQIHNCFPNNNNINNNLDINNINNDSNYNHQSMIENTNSNQYPFHSSTNRNHYESHNNNNNSNNIDNDSSYPFRRTLSNYSNHSGQFGNNNSGYSNNYAVDHAMRGLNESSPYKPSSSPFNHNTNHQIDVMAKYNRTVGDSYNDHHKANNNNKSNNTFNNTNNNTFNHTDTDENNFAPPGLLFSLPPSSSQPPSALVKPTLRNPSSMIPRAPINTPSRYDDSFTFPQTYSSRPYNNNGTPAQNNYQPHNNQYQPRSNQSHYTPNNQSFPPPFDTRNLPPFE